MLRVGALSESESNLIFSGSKSIEMLPVISAEWNHNLFNPPYITVAGDGTPETISTSSTLTSVTDSNKHPNFNTNSFELDRVSTGYSFYNGKKVITWTIDDITSNPYSHKIVMYAKTNSLRPVLINIYAEGQDQQIGSSSIEIDSFGWTKIELYTGNVNTITSNTQIKLVAQETQDTYAEFAEDWVSPIIYITEPESYITSEFDFHYGSIWPTSSAFKFLRSGESYVTTGNSSIPYPSNYRRVSTKILANETLSGNFYGNKYMPINPIVYNPKFSLSKIPSPIYKNGVANNVLPYQYFISSEFDFEKVISAIYEKNLMSNKIVIKFNILMSIPTVNIKLNSTSLGNFTPDSNGLLVLYYNGTSWSTDKWTNSNKPHFSNNGELTPTYNEFKKITITRVSETLNTNFNNSLYTRDEVIDSDGNVIQNDIKPELKRMQIIEISPRLEIDLSDFIQNISINKSLDSKNNYIPISSINSNDASITLSGIPANTSLNFTPIFSSQSDSTRTILSNMLRKNVKFYISYNLISHDTVALPDNTFIPGGVFYSDSWEERDIDTISIQAYDISRYLQTTPTPDYVSITKSVFNVISDLLDKAGFTDYDYDSLYNVTNDLNSPMDMNYYFSSSQDTTLIDALSEIFLAYQIGAYIDEYGIMKFLSLSNILFPKTTSLSISENDIIENGYSISNKATPGKISLRYNPPKIKQSLSLNNSQTTLGTSKVGDKVSPSVIITTSNDVVWSQQNLDSVGFNYLISSMSKEDNTIVLKVSDILDIFHTYSLNNNGYAIVEGEIISFNSKEYLVGDKKVSVKNDLELQAAISNEIKSNINEYGTTKNYSPITSIVADGTYITYNCVNAFKLDSKVSVINSSDPKFNIINKKIETLTTSYFTVKSSIAASTGSGGKAIVNTGTGNDVYVFPTGKITNTKRGLFGTKISAHNLITSMASKDLSQGIIDSSYSITTGGTNATAVHPVGTSTTDRIGMNCPEATKVIFYPTSQLDPGYQTYSMKFNFTSQSNPSDTVATGLFFNFLNLSSAQGGYFVEFARYTINEKYKYACVIYRVESGSHIVIAWADITSITNSVLDNMPKVMVENPDYDENAPNNDKYNISIEQSFNLKVVHYPDEIENGNVTYNNNEVIGVFLNNIEVTGWQIINPDIFTPTTLEDFIPIGYNQNTLKMKKVELPTTVSPDTFFGVFASSSTVMQDFIPEIVPTVGTYNVVDVQELHGTEKALKEKSVNYFYQDREFLNGILQGQRFYEKSYMMQTRPEVIGMNYYDVQYTNPAASIVDVYPIEYAWYYFPTNSPVDQKYFQKQIVDEYSVAYSTPINTGFKAKMAIVNNSPHMVYLNKESDEVNSFTVRLNLWTHEIIATSDQQILEKEINESNSLEVAQIDSQWIQSTDAARKMLNLIGKGIEGFSKDVSLEIFGNPLIQVGDIVNLSYSYNGINNQKYVVHSVSQSFNDGLSTQLLLNKISSGTSQSPVNSTFKITYEGNNNTSGSVPVDSGNYNLGGTTTVASEGSLSRSGYIFNGWNTEFDGGGISYGTGSTFTFASINPVLYAQWTAIVTYRVNYDEQGGSSVNNDIYSEGGSIILPNPPTRNGYSFNGWFTVSSGGVPLTSPYFPPGIGNITLYAQWTSSISNIVTFNENGGTPVSDIQYTPGQSITLPSTTRSGYHFDGWIEYDFAELSTLQSPYYPKIKDIWQTSNTTAISTVLPDLNWQNSKYGNGKFVLKSLYTNNIVSTTDGITWSLNTLPSASGWSSEISYGNGVFLAYAYDQQVAVSTDTITWSTSSLPFYTVSIMYNNGIFLGINGYNQQSMVSTNGITWDSYNTTIPFDRLEYLNNLFIARQQINNSNTIGSSTDGITWSIGTLPYVVGYWYPLKYGSGKYIAGNSDEINFAYSTDTITWTSFTFPIAVYIDSMKYKAGKFIANAETNNIVYSTDAITWTINTLPINDYWSQIVYRNGIFATVTYSGYLATSTDAITWSLNNKFDSIGWDMVDFANENFVVYLPINNESGSVTLINTSINAIDWISNIIPGYIEYRSFRKINNNNIASNYNYPQAIEYSNTTTGNIELKALWGTSFPTTYSPQGRVGTQIITADINGNDDGAWTINLPYPIYFDGTEYSTIYIATNSAITFDSINPTLINNSNMIMISSSDRYGNSIWFEDNGTSWRIRYEGANYYYETGNDIIWEISSDISTPDVLKVDIVSLGLAGITGAYGVTGNLIGKLGGEGTAWNITSL